MTVKEVLVRARELISDPVCWRRGDLAWSGRNEYVPPNNPAACQWCALGAISAAVDYDDYPMYDGPEAQDAVRLLAGVIYELYPHLMSVAEKEAGADEAAQNAVFRLNDRPWGGHAKVLEAFDEAIASCDA